MESITPILVVTRQKALWIDACRLDEPVSEGVNEHMKVMVRDVTTGKYEEIARGVISTRNPAARDRDDLPEFIPAQDADNIRQKLTSIYNQLIDELVRVNATAKVDLR